MSWKTILVLGIVVVATFAFPACHVTMPPWLSSLLASLAAIVLAEMQSSGVGAAVRAALGTSVGEASKASGEKSP